MNYPNNLVIVEVSDDGVATVALNNPPLNVVTVALAAELYETMTLLERDERVGVVVLHGKGKGFSAGSDVREFPAVRAEVVDRKLKRENEAFNAIEFLSRPTIAALEGATCGGGLEMAMACDIRIMSDAGKLGFPETNLGIFPASGGLFRLPKLVGQAKALELMYLGDFIGADECLAIGLVNRVVAAGTALDAAGEMARRLAEKPREALKRIKAGVRRFQNRATEEIFLDNLRLSADLWDSPDAREGVQAFLEKRPPRFARRGKE